MAAHPALEKHECPYYTVTPFIKRSRSGVLRGCVAVDGHTLHISKGTRDREVAWAYAHETASLVREGLLE